MTDTATTPAPAKASDLSPGWLLAGGVLTWLAGMFMLVFPVLASLSVTLFAGWSLVFAGIVGFAAAIRNRAEGGMWTGIVLGLLATIAGFLLVFNPLKGTLTLTMVFVWWMVIDGALGMVLSVLRRGPAWGWWFVSSLIGLVLGIVLLGSLPLGAAWILGLFVGISLLLRGMMLVATSFEVRRLQSGS